MANHSSNNQAPSPGPAASSSETDSDEAVQRKHKTYFDYERNCENIEWLERMGLKIPLQGLKILEVGCGHGALSIRLAELGAAEVIGLDLNRDRVEFAARNLAQDFPQLQDRVQFVYQDAAELTPDGQFDLIISKDTFEHVEDLTRLVGHLHRLLKPGGHLVSGFSPLYYSPFGDHGRFRLGLPWAHALLPESVLVWLRNLRFERQISSCADLSLNRLTPAEYRRIFDASAKWEELSIAYNRGSKRLLPLFSVLRRVPFVEKYFTISIYSVVQKFSGDAT